jgi:GLUG motif-containing protein
MPFARTPIFRVWSFLALVIALSASLGAAAEFADGTGEPADPYRIATAEQLVSIGNDPDLLEKYYRLIDDIDLDPNLPGGQVFTKAVIASTETPYPSRRAKFTGRFYADGHVIRHLTIDSNDGQYLGLFGYVGSSGRVYDLNLEAVSIRGAARMGALAGYNEGGLVTCSATGNITGDDGSSWVGGLVGINAGSLSGCYADVAIRGGLRSTILGGLAGWHEGRILNCRAAGRLSAAEGSFLLGGLVGRSLGGAIEDSHAQGPVVGHAGSWALGGLAGRLDSGSLMIRCSATGDVTADGDGHDLGGLVGQNWYGSMRGCFATGAVDGGQRNHTLGGLVGSCWGGRIIACHADGSVSGQAGSRLLGGLVGELQAASVVANCYAETSLLMDGRLHGHGGLVGRIASPHDVRVVQCFWDIEASGATVSAAGEGLTTAEMQDRQTYQQAGWDLAGDRTDGTTETWRLPEDGGAPVLTGLADSNALPALEGAGKSFDPYIIATAEDLGAVTYHNRKGWFKLVADIDLAGITWTAAPIPDFHGIFDGHGHHIKNLTVRSNGTEPVGLFGRVAEGAWVYDLGLDDVSIEAADGAADVGGLAGTNAGTIVNCYATGRIAAGAGARSAGGLVGSSRQGTVGDCYATVTVTGGPGSSQLGGLIGYNFLGPVVTCYAAGTITGAAGSTRLGAIIGHNAERAPVAGCYYVTDGSPDPEGTPLTDLQMKRQTSFADWDFAQTWMICEDQTYPHFIWERITCDP